MISSNHILALSGRGHLMQQLRTVFAAGSRSVWRESFRRSWGLPDPHGD
jgi:hypothetical protein